jgi:hypothetical protein
MMARILFNPDTFDYKKFIESNFSIIDKHGARCDFRYNPVQARFDKEQDHDILILKARQQGFSSVIDAIFTTDFILRENSYGAIVADIEDNAVGLLDRIKFFLNSYEEKNKKKINFTEKYIKSDIVDLKYDSRFELYHDFMNSRLVIGTSKNVEFGRSKTITNLHLSEIAFYNNIQKITMGAGQAVVEGGRKWLETTANGFNELKTLWDRSCAGESNYKPLFYKASDFYDKKFLDRKMKELEDNFPQEYPESATEAFITSGQCFFNKESLGKYLKQCSPELNRLQFNA